MTRAVPHGARRGSVCVPSSKSQMHRLLILAALGSSPVSLRFDGLSQDIAATAACLRALGVGIETVSETELRVTPGTGVPAAPCALPCRESGSTLRFLLPLCGLLGAEAVFRRAGRLPERPLAPFDAVLQAHGMRLCADGALLRVGGKLRSGDFSLPGNVSSQYISALLMTLPFLDGDSTLRITGSVESAAYLTMTEQVLALSGVRLEKDGALYRIPGGQTAQLPPVVQAEGDYSSAAFFLCAGALSPSGITVRGLSAQSQQGDRAVLELLRDFGAEVRETDGAVTVRRGTLHGIRIDAAPIPDLIPALSVVAAVSEGETVVENAARLRLKESDRLQTTAALLRALGGDVEERSDALVIRGKPALRGGDADANGDHRIAMSAALAACASETDVTVSGSECVEKSYPRFWDDFTALKGDAL